MKKFLVGLGAAAFLASPAAAQSVRAGIAAWQKGDHALAVATWTPLAAAGDADAAFNLAQAYRLGKGAAPDLARATRLFAQAAAKGHVDAAATLGILQFQNGNRAEGLRWLKVAAEGGEPRSLLLYGIALYNGDGIAPDPVASYAYVSRAVALGLNTAKTTLAELDASLPLDQRRRGVAMAQAMGGPKAPLPATRARPAPATAVRARAGTAESGGWRIQLGAFGRQAAAEGLYARLSGKLGGRQAFYVPAGPVVRLQAGPYESRAAAERGCAALGAQACFPVRAR